ncbi:MAG: hypothetical protein JST61_05700 [Acidobacteria bacterium]|nr:hypothetical protein [Acidobacteriota bacterium]
MNRDILLVVALITCGQPLLFAQVRVPYVGCKADGQAGPLDPPHGMEKTISAAPERAQQLSYYKAEQGFGVLGPRGWFCFEVYGSNGSSLYVSPAPINPDNLFSNKWSGFTGPVIELNSSDGDTSGRFGVAFIIARVFPAHRAFVRKVIKEGLEPENSFHYGPYPQDKLTYKNSELVEFQTPGHSNGMGTTSRIRKNADPIHGVAILVGPTPDLVHLSVRLPSDLNSLTSTIVHQIEQDTVIQQ